MDVWLTKVEHQMAQTLAVALDKMLDTMRGIYGPGKYNVEEYFALVEQHPCQCCLLASQVMWTSIVSEALDNGGGDALTAAGDFIKQVLDGLADRVLSDVAPNLRKTFEHLITELVHERDVIRDILAQGVSDSLDFR